MAPLSVSTRATTRRFTALLPSLLYHARSYDSSNSNLYKREEGGIHSSTDIVFAVLIPVLVLLSGVFAGLTLGYMSLDDTQLHVLSISGTPKQREYANKIKPIRKNGHLLLVTLLLANMIVNESLPIISERVLGGGIQSVVISTVLIIIFAEIIPQSICTRYGLVIGAKMATPVQILIYVFGIVAYPVAKILEFMLGAHHGIIYRRTELKELIAMHSDMATHGGDLADDTVNIIGATLDLQEKVVKQAMTPINQVFMLSIDDVLDFDLLRKIVKTGHSRVPVYDLVDIKGIGKCKKIVGILLVKHCVLLDPQSAVPLRQMTLNHVPFVPSNMPLLRILDRFQEGRSHMAIVSRISVEKAASVKVEVKQSLTRRLKEKVGFADDSSSSSSDDDNSDKTEFEEKRATKENRKSSQNKNPGLQLPLVGLEQRMPADAVLAKDAADEFLQGVDPAIMPVGIITLEDVVEELIGEEIYDEFDPEGAHLNEDHYDPAKAVANEKTEGTTDAPVSPTANVDQKAEQASRPSAIKSMSFFRPRSAPSRPRPPKDAVAAANTPTATATSSTTEIDSKAKPEVKVVEPKTKLEAILLDRQRRFAQPGAPAASIAATSAGVLPVSPTGSPTIVPAIPRIAKGGKFKSSPLTGSNDPTKVAALSSIVDVPQDVLPDSPEGTSHTSGAGIQHAIGDSSKSIPESDDAKGPDKGVVSPSDDTNAKPQ